MTIRDGFWQALLGRIEAALGAFLATRIQRRLIRHSIDDATEIERQARQLDAENMPELAAALREGAGRLDPEDPCHTGETIMRKLGNDNGTCQRRIEHESIMQAEDDGRTTGRRSNRRTRRVKTDD